MKKIAVAIRYRIFFSILLLIAVWIIYSNFSDYNRNQLLEVELNGFIYFNYVDKLIAIF